MSSLMPNELLLSLRPRDSASVLRKSISLLLFTRGICLITQIVPPRLNLSQPSQQRTILLALVLVARVVVVRRRVLATHALLRRLRRNLIRRWRITGRLVLPTEATQLPQAELLNLLMETLTWMKRFWLATMFIEGFGTFADPHIVNFFRSSSGVIFDGPPWTIIFLAAHFLFRRLKLTAVVLLLLLYCTWLSIRFGKAFHQLYGYRGSLGVITHHNAYSQGEDKLVSCTDCILGTNHTTLRLLHRNGIH
jgi:hypothetical protein